VADACNIALAKPEKSCHKKCSCFMSSTIIASAINRHGFPIFLMPGMLRGRCLQHSVGKTGKKLPKKAVINRQQQSAASSLQSQTDFQFFHALLALVSWMLHLCCVCWTRKKATCANFPMKMKINNRQMDFQCLKMKMKSTVSCIETSHQESTDFF